MRRTIGRWISRFAHIYFRYAAISNTWYGVVKAGKDRKAWQRFREIPEWIDLKMKNGFTISQSMDKLEEMRLVAGKSRLIGTSVLVELFATERKAAAKSAKDGNNLDSTGLASSISGETMSIALGSKRHAPTVGGRPKPKKERRS